MNSATILGFLNGLLYPPNLSFLLLTIACVALFLRKRFFSVMLIGVAIIWIVMWSLPVTTLVAGGFLEDRYASLAAKDYPTADAIVVLGGHIQGNRSNWFTPYDKQMVRSRETLAAELFRAQRAPVIVLSGGALEGPIGDTNNMARNLVQNGIPERVIVLETSSQNTFENALLTQKTLSALEKKRILLVTSALHMPRSMAAFEKQPIEVTAAPLPKQITVPHLRPLNIWQPDALTLESSRSILKEYLGLFVYWLRGWV
jgi:uncharacterized SAM-binding protein YcdF (DUF218 family)